MKKLISLFLVLVSVIGLAACGNNQPQTNDSSNFSSEFSPEPATERTQVPADTSNPESFESEDRKTLVVYFSATGNTENAANYIAEATGADIFKLEPVEAYSDADLNYNDDGSRVVYEHDNPDARAVELVADTVDNWESYDTVFIGYPIWWGIAAWPVDDFIKSNDFTGKTVVPFATSASSGLGESGELLKEMAGTGNWLEGERFSSGVSKDTVSEWIEGLNLFETESTEIPSAQPETDAKNLVVYFSMPETTDPNNMTQEEDNSTVVINGEVLGNTQYVAYVIQEQTNADIFRIEPETPYPTDHDALVDLAADEQDNNARPAIKDTIENFDQYENIFVGYPNWWGDMPMILYTFFDTYDFSGKTIIPFNTHGGSGFSGTIGTIADLEPNATVNEDGFTVSRNNVQEAEPDIISWLQDLGYTK